ncbi:MAG TPA: hypothetical protein VJI68_00205 [Candidatus Nanoarchaeia archaeon]|nr:hypothetical protein [Candidatus Nanoarchaeia archaeon]
MCFSKISTFFKNLTTNKLESKNNKELVNEFINCIKNFYKEVEKLELTRYFMKLEKKAVKKRVEYELFLLDRIEDILDGDEERNGPWSFTKDEKHEISEEYPIFNICNMAQIEFLRDWKQEEGESVFHPFADVEIKASEVRKLDEETQEKLIKYKRLGREIATELYKRLDLEARRRLKKI